MLIAFNGTLTVLSELIATTRTFSKKCETNADEIRKEMQQVCKLGKKCKINTKGIGEKKWETNAMDKKRGKKRRENKEKKRKLKQRKNKEKQKGKKKRKKKKRRKNKDFLPGSAYDLVFSIEAHLWPYTPNIAVKSVFARMRGSQMVAATCRHSYGGSRITLGPHMESSHRRSQPSVDFSQV